MTPQTGFVVEENFRLAFGTTNQTNRTNQRNLIGSRRENRKNGDVARMIDLIKRNTGFLVEPENVPWEMSRDGLAWTLTPFSFESP
jgi:hypothetical protein